MPIRYYVSDIAVVSDFCELNSLMQSVNVGLKLHWQWQRFSGKATSVGGMFVNYWRRRCGFVFSKYRMSRVCVCGCGFSMIL